MPAPWIPIKALMLQEAMQVTGTIDPTGTIFTKDTPVFKAAPNPFQSPCPSTQLNPNDLVPKG